MRFDEFAYLPIFFVFVICLQIIQGRRARIVWTLLFSYLFYAFASYWFLPLLILSSVIDYSTGRLLEKTDSRKLRLILIGISLCFNLGLLIFFKYWGTGFSGSEWVIPAGISFYTFQSLSYSLDVFDRKTKACRSLPEFLAFVSFFPQLVAGPIMRVNQFMGQLNRLGNGTIRDFNFGLTLIFWGLSKKLLVADNLAPQIERLYSIAPQNASAQELWLGCLLFSVQIYCDFSGYCDIARGSARIVGIRLPTNFRWPYLATSFREFWRKWHITLMQWFRDYLYFRIGGNRGTRVKVIRNVMIVWIIPGVWHGSGFNFLRWGVYNGVGVLLSPAAASTGMRRVFQIVPTFLAVSLGWHLFRSDTAASGVERILRSFYAWDSKSLDIIPISLVIALSSVVIHLLTKKYWMRLRRVGIETGLLDSPWRISASMGVLLVFVYLLRGPMNSFLYFQF